jgi:hypothetical protein
MHYALPNGFVLGKLKMGPPSSTLHICVLQLAPATLSNPGCLSRLMLALVDACVRGTVSL